MFKLFPQTVLALKGSYLVFSELPLGVASDGRRHPVVVVVVAWLPMACLPWLLIACLRWLPILGFLCP